MNEDRPGPDEFEREARRRRTSWLRDFVALLMQNKKWWMLPIVLVLMLLALLVVLGHTPLAPFIYTLF